MKILLFSYEIFLMKDLALMAFFSRYIIRILILKGKLYSGIIFFSSAFFLSKTKIIIRYGVNYDLTTRNRHI